MKTLAIGAIITSYAVGGYFIATFCGLSSPLHNLSLALAGGIAIIVCASLATASLGIYGGKKRETKKETKEE